MGKATDYLLLLVVVMAVYAGYLVGQQVGLKKGAAAVSWPAASGPAALRMSFEDESLKAELRLKKHLPAEYYQYLHDLNVLYFNSLAPVLRPENDQVWLCFHNLSYGLKTAAAYNQSLLDQRVKE
ncbi:MAG: hypothetical protein MUC28_02050 [Planctomycetes bacterium]|jgi:hypothetical protein|nr:hypothetical protein [Planctomycetota bacterium]